VGGWGRAGNASEPPEHRPRTWGRRPSVADPSHPGLLPALEPSRLMGTSNGPAVPADRRAACHPYSRDERRKRTNDFAGKKGKFTISRPLAPIIVDVRPNKALECRQHGASLCRRSYRSTAPSGIGQDKRTSSNDRGAWSVECGAWSVERGAWSVDRTHNRQCLASSMPTRDEGRRMKTEESQQIMSRELQPKNRQGRLVYKRSNFAGKPQFSATFGHARRAFQSAIQAQHVVAAT
jgi:hypothetical protein